MNNPTPISTRRGILAGGNWILDRIKTIDVYPEQDALANILAEEISNGGGPYNLLIDLAKVGAPFPLSAVGLLGQDAAGQQIRKDCRKHKIDIAQLQITSQSPTAYTDVMTVKSTGRRTFFHQRGANALLSDAHFDFETTSAKIFHLGYLLLLDSLDLPHADGTVAAHVLRRAQEAGLFTSIDVVSEDSRRFESIVVPALRFCDICFMNEFEAGRTTGLSLRDRDELQWQSLPTAAQMLLDCGVRGWVVIHFPEGAFALGAGGECFVQGSIKVPKIAGVVGAGDAFAAGVLYGIHEDAGMEQALRFGAGVAAACLQHPSTSGGVGPLNECLRLAEEYGVSPTCGNGDSA